VDWYVDVSLCYLDVYNVSGDEIRFVEKRIEDADLDTVARVIGNVKLKVAPQKSLAFIGKSLAFIGRAGWSFGVFRNERSCSLEPRSV